MSYVIMVVTFNLFGKAHKNAPIGVLLWEIVSELHHGFQALHVFAVHLHHVARLLALASLGRGFAHAPGGH